MKTLSKNALIGYPAGIITGITYGLNPLFGMPLMNNGASIESILFFRYGIAVLILGALLLFDKQSYIPSGLATTLIFLYPVIVALIMVFLRVIPSWQVWLAIVVTFAGVIIMTQSDSTQEINPIGVWLSLGSALVYALFIVIINRSKAIGSISNSLLTFYSLSVGAVIFMGKIITSGADITTGIESKLDWLNLVGLALLPTIVSTASLAVATRNIGATKASVLGVFEPITAILVGTLVFGEVLTDNIIVGILLAMGAVTFMIISTKR